MVSSNAADQSPCMESVFNTNVTELVFPEDALILRESLTVLVVALEVLHQVVKPLELNGSILPKPRVSFLKTCWMMQFSLSMHVMMTRRSSPKVSHTLVVECITEVGFTRKKLDRFVWPTELWTHPAWVCGVVDIYAEKNSNLLSLVLPALLYGFENTEIWLKEASRCLCHQVSLQNLRVSLGWLCAKLGTSS